MSRKPDSAPIILELSSSNKPLVSPFFDQVSPATFPKAILRYKNNSAAHQLGLSFSNEEWARYFHRFEPYPGNLPEPLALRYHGHQFRYYNPDLGDGRGFLYAQFKADQIIYDLATKGSGQTPYSRSGDGKLTLKGAVREALATEMLESLGVKTSKTFCFFETGESLQRNDEPSPTRSAVLTRMSQSHLRIGTFQRIAHLGETENLLRLLDFSVEHYFPDLLHKAQKSSAKLAALFLQRVSENLANLASEYMLAGFVHGVLNSDNMNITGESFDYGPYRFLPIYDLNFTAAYFDHAGLYAYGRQPSAIHWNVHQLGLALQTAYSKLPVNEILNDSGNRSFGEIFEKHCQEIFFSRLNLKQTNKETDTELMRAFFQFLGESKAPFEQVFFDLHSGIHEKRLEGSPLSELYRSSSFENLKKLLLEQKIENPNLMNHEYFTHSKPCTLLIDEIETIWQAIAEKDDWSLFEKKLEQIRGFRGIYST